MPPPYRFHPDPQVDGSFGIILTPGRPRAAPTQPLESPDHSAEQSADDNKDRLNDPRPEEHDCEKKIEAEQEEPEMVPPPDGAVLQGDTSLDPPLDETFFATERLASALFGHRDLCVRFRSSGGPDGTFRRYDRFRVIVVSLRHAALSNAA